MADIEYKTPQDVADEKARVAAGKAYDKSLTSTEAAPMPKEAASAPKTTVKKANGGYVKAADGIAQRGKTRGKMC